MTEAEKPDRRSSGLASIGLAIGIGVVLLVGFGLLAFRDFQSKQGTTAFMTNSAAFSKRWVENLQAGRLDETYAATTPAFKARLDRDAFGRWADDHPVLKAESYTMGFTTSSFSSGISIGLNGIRLINSAPTMTFRTKLLPAGNPPSVLTLNVVSDGAGNPLVNQAEIGPEAPSKP